MDLKEELEKIVEHARKNFPPEIFKTILDETKRLDQSGINEESLKTGDKAPSFSLPNIKGDMISSDVLLAEGPLVINFFRGGW